MSESGTGAAKYSVMRASFIRQPIDHMSGGISRGKRTVDYDKVKVE